MEMPRWNNTAWLKRINFIGHAPQRHVNKHPQPAWRHRWLPNPPNLGWGVAKSYFFSVPTLLSINIWLFLGDFRLFSNPNLVAMETISRSAHLLENRTRALERHNSKGSDFSESTAQIPLIQRCLPALWQSQELLLCSGPRGAGDMDRVPIPCAAPAQTPRHGHHPWNCPEVVEAPNTARNKQLGGFSLEKHSRDRDLLANTAHTQNRFLAEHQVRT